MRENEKRKLLISTILDDPSSPGLPRVGSGALKHQKWVPPGGSGRCVRAPSRGPGAEPSLGGTDSLAISRTLIAIWWPRVAPSYLSPFSSLRNVLLMSVYPLCLVARPNVYQVSVLLNHTLTCKNLKSVPVFTLFKFVNLFQFILSVRLSTHLPTCYNACPTQRLVPCLLLTC